MTPALALLALALQAPAAPAKAAPLSVQVQVPARADAAAQAWAKELRAAVEARKDELRPVGPGQPADLVVRIDSVAKGQNDSQVMNGALVVGKTTRPFNLSYTGASAPQAEKLARNLRKYADQMKATGK